jgi:TolA-binding protein
LERHDYLREVEYGKFQASWDAWNKEKQLIPNFSKPEPKPNNTNSKLELSNGIAILRKLVTEFPTHPKTPKALYVLGQSMLLAGNDNAEEYLTRLVKSFPDSEVFPDGCLALGEFYFERRKMSLAQENYKKVLRFKEHKAFIYALYKLGWTNYNLAHDSEGQSAKLFEQSLTSMKLVVRMTMKTKETTKKNNLHDEAINDLIVIWADAGEIEGAFAFFKEVGAEDKYYDMLERLAGIYGDQGKKKEAMTLYNKILSETPLRKRNPEVLTKMVELSEDGVNIVKLADVIKTMNDFLAPTSPWSKEWEKDKELSAKVLDNREKLTKFYGTKFHKINQKSANKDYAISSAKIYANYLDHFPKNPSAYEIRYYLADLLLTLGQPEASAKQFLIVAQTKEQDKYRKEASTSAVAAAELNMTKNKIDDLNLVPSSKPTPLPKERVLWKQTIENFVSFFPNDPLAPTMMFSLGSTLFRYGYKADAIKVYETIATRFPDTKQGKDAAKFVIEFEFENKNYDNLYAKASLYLKVPQLIADKPLHTHLLGRLREAVFGKGLALEEEKKFKEAGDHFSNFQKSYPADDIADKALFNAITNYSKAGFIVGVVSTSELLISAYPKSKLRADVLATLAETRENLGEFDRAQSHYMQFATEYPSDTRSRLAVVNCARLRKGLGKVSDSKAAYLFFVRSWPGDPLVLEIKKELAQMLEDANAKSEAKEAWQTYLDAAPSQEEKLNAEAHLGFNSEDKDKSKILRSVAGKLSKSKLKANEARSIVGKYLFAAAEKDVDNFLKQSTLNPKSLEESIKSKNQVLLGITTKLVEVTEISGPEYIVAANVKLGDMHKAFAKDLINLEPTGKKEDVETIKNQLEKLSLGLSDQAKEYFQEAMKASADIPSFTPWSKTAYERMSEINPTEYRNISIEVIQPNYLGHRLKLTDDTKSLSH